MITIHCIKQPRHPESVINECVERLANSSHDDCVFALDYGFDQVYLPNAPLIELLAVVVLSKTADGIEVETTIATKTDSLLDSLEELPARAASVREWADQHDLVWLRLDKPIRLQPVHIPKPWGREIWYTGIEARGQSRVVDERGRSMPLPWLLSLCPHRLLADHASQPILLKILDPLPQPVLGDLYFEMHEEKREVYVVTHVDETAWPEGVGGIRFGFNQHERSRFASDKDFKDSYLAAVNEYRAVREEIDARIDQYRVEQDFELDAPLPAETLEQRLAEIPATLRERERHLRATMEAFIQVDPLRVGDVVKVPCFTPHSLLHGVRTVEFQTPVYERKILSFAQKVLTQPHWDTAAALERISLEPPAVTELPVLIADNTIQVEEVAVFEDFRVERITLKAGRTHELESGSGYCLLMAVVGEFAVNAAVVKAEQAVLVAAGVDRLLLDNRSRRDVVALLARPVRQGAPLQRASGERPSVEPPG